MTYTPTTATVARIDRPADMFARNGAMFYRVTPGKGARVSGIVAVGVTAGTANTYGDDGRLTRVDTPALWFDLSPIPADGDNRTVGGDHHPLMVNGVARTIRFGGRVEYIPTKGDGDHRRDYYPAVTIGGVEYLVMATIDGYETGLSDAATETVHAVMTAIALDAMTDARWHAYRVAVAQRAVTRAADAVADAVKALDAARAELAALTAETN